MLWRIVVSVAIGEVLLCLLLAELAEDNQQLVKFLRATHEICDEHNDVATASLIENWIDETERRTWFLFEAAQ